MKWMIQIDVCGNYILIYDVQGTQAAILTNTGFKQTIKTAMPIVDANIASQGTVAILMQDGEAGYVQVCNDAGKVLASGELHMKNSGYPLAESLFPLLRKGSWSHNWMSKMEM